MSGNETDNAGKPYTVYEAALLQIQTQGYRLNVLIIFSLRVLNISVHSVQAQHF